MMLVQKPPNLPTSLNQHHHNHRRHPSAPVVVYPTRTPGLLSLSMGKPAPPKQSQQQQQRHHRSPKTKPAGPHSRSPKSAPAEAQQVGETETPKKPQQPTPGLSPDKHVRGRQQAHSKPAVKDKIARRSASQSAQGGRNINRQHSPPIQTASQAEGPPANNSKSSLFDPFIVASDSESDNNVSRPTTTTVKTAHPAHPTPKLANPSGKLARRRQHHAPSTPTPVSKAVPVPRPNNGKHNRAHSAMISRSAPITSPAGMGAFPICDDTTDADGSTPPSTPTKGKNSTLQQTLQAYGDGPRTAPLSSTYSFPFGPGGVGLPSLTPSPSSRRHRHHARTPSEGVFNMSFDEDPYSSDHANEGLKMLFGTVPKRAGQGYNLRSTVHVSNTAHPNSSASKAAKAALYASSLFQNSPSPDELPPPAF